MLRRPGGPTYEVILDELAVRRASAPPEVFRAQLHHIAATADGSGKISARVLPVEAVIEGFSLPRSAFSIYTFADSGDPTVVAVDTVTDDLMLTEGDDVKRYEELYERLSHAALSMSDSLEFLRDVATRVSG
jgi:hypothetical protein